MSCLKKGTFQLPVNPAAYHYYINVTLYTIILNKITLETQLDTLLERGGGKEEKSPLHSIACMIYGRPSNFPVLLQIIIIPEQK